MASSSSSTSTVKKLRFKTSDGEIFEVAVEVAKEWLIIKNMIEDHGPDAGTVIPLPNVTGKALEKVIDYCKKHAEEGKKKQQPDYKDPFSPFSSSPDALKEWDAEFIKIDKNTLFDILMAANYLNVPSLLDLACDAAAGMMKRKNPDEIRKIFKIENDFTPEEEREINGELASAFR